MITIFVLAQGMTLATAQGRTLDDAAAKIMALVGFWWDASVQVTKQQVGATSWIWEVK